MKCGKCEYDLSGISNLVRCPECGTTDILSVGTQWRWLNRLAIATGLIPISFIAILHIMLVVARLELGRWPSRGGMHDPATIPLVQVLYVPAWVLGFMGIPLALFATLYIVLATLVSCIRSEDSVLPRVLVALSLVAVWFACYIALRHDPAQVVVWFLD